MSFDWSNCEIGLKIASQSSLVDIYKMPTYKLSRMAHFEVFHRKV